MRKRRFALQAYLALALLPSGFYLLAADSPAPPALEIVSARWGAGNRWTDVTSQVQKRVQGGALDMPVNPQQFTVDPAPRVHKQLQITYKLNGQQKSVTFQGQTQAHIGTTVQDTALAQKLAALRKDHPTGLLIVDAQYGTDGHWADVTGPLQSVVWHDSLTVKVADDAFGDVAPNRDKELRIATDDGKTGLKNQTVPAGQTLQIGDVEVPVLERDGKIINLAMRAEQLKTKLGDVLIVLDARFGEGNRWFDATDQLQRLVHGKGLVVYVGDETFGNPAPGAAFKELDIWYWDGSQVVYKTVPEGRSAGFGEADPRDATLPPGIAGADTSPDSRASASDGSPPPPARAGRGTPARGGVAGRGAVARGGRSSRGNSRGGAASPVVDDSLLAKVEAMRPKYGDGLIILDATFGAGNRLKDVTQELQDQVSANSLVFRSRTEDWGDPAPGALKEVRITYWDGREIKRTKAGDGNQIILEGTKPDALLALKPFPEYVVEGQSITHAFGGKGVYTLTTATEGMSLSADGTLRWTPAPDQQGVQRFQFTYKEGDKEYWDAETTEILSRETAAPAGGDPSKLTAVMRLALDPGKGGFYANNPDFHDSLILDGEKLIITGPDGLLPARTLPLTEAYIRVGERKDYYMAVDPGAEDLLDKATGKVVKTIPFAYHNFQDVAFKPDEPFTFLAVKTRMTVPRDQIIIVNESTGNVTAPKDLTGTFLQFDRTGQHLWVGIKDIYETGSEFHIDPAWNIYETPTYGNIDMLLRFDTGNGQMVLKDKIENAGGNGSGIRVSPDGKRASYLSFTGYPQGQKNAPAWNGMDFSEEPVGYDMHGVNGDGGPHNITYHPVLPLVAIPRAGGATFISARHGHSG